MGLKEARVAHDAPLGGRNPVGCGPGGTVASLVMEINLRIPARTRRREAWEKG